ncbi:MAG: GNAT family N-acetyltransferase [Betaproteobacteria bacterium]|jgi:GNAT superfamily N-acetyltransferase|nr:GNAT family N-acetyltransferase [Betaproteobacteria bacterium]
MPIFNSDRPGRREAPESSRPTPAAPEPDGVHVRLVQVEDLDRIIAIDTHVTGVEKTDYWYEVFHRYGARSPRQRFFFVAEVGGEIEGYVIGEVRDWEFGSPPCGWVFGITVRPETRLGGVGTALLKTICDAFRRTGVSKVRTLLARDNQLVLSFFRSQGMMAAPFIPLELDLA